MAEMRHARAEGKVAEIQETKFAEQANRDSIERAALLCERLIQYSQAYCKEQGLAPEELVFAAALMTVNLRESFPSGKEAFDNVAAAAAEYYDKNS